MTVFMWSAGSPAEDWRSVLDELRAVARTWFRTKRSPRRAAAGTMERQRVAGGDAGAVRIAPTVFHPPGVIRVLTPAEEEAEVRRLYGSASAARVRK